MGAIDAIERKFGTTYSGNLEKVIVALCHKVCLRDGARVGANLHCALARSVIRYGKIGTGEAAVIIDLALARLYLPTLP